MKNFLRNLWTSVLGSLLIVLLIVWLSLLLLGGYTLTRFLAYKLFG